MRRLNWGSLPSIYQISLREDEKECTLKKYYEDVNSAHRRKMSTSKTKPKPKPISVFEIGYFGFGSGSGFGFGRFPMSTCFV